MKNYDEFMFSIVVERLGDIYYEIYDLKNKKLYEFDPYDGSFKEHKYVDPNNIKNVVEKYNSLNYPNNIEELYDVVDSNYLDRYPEIYMVDNEPMFMGMSVYTVIATEISNDILIFDDKYYIKYIEEAIKNNFESLEFNPELYDEIINRKKMINSPEYIFYTEYCNSDGVLISSYEEYRYWFKLFVMLTAASIGNYSPISSDVGFSYFYKIFSKTYSHKKINMKKEYNIFFKSIDAINTYT